MPSISYLNQLSKTNNQKIHLKINTGMNRLGLSLVELLNALTIIRKSSLVLEGIYTHFHSADIDRISTLSQLELFRQAIYQTKYYFPQVLAHAANSDAIFKFNQSHLDMVRPGLAVYGLAPYPKLVPALSWKTEPIQYRLLSPRSTVGYGATFSSHKPISMAVLPIGYSDGLDRKLGNVGYVWAKNKHFPIIGRISMNLTTIDAKNSNPRQYEIIGKHNPATAIANQIGTINYEVVSRLNPLITRIIVK